MSLDNQPKTEVKIDSSVNVRRKFIKRASAGVVISSLPAKSVWGACNASGISGGSQSTDSCELPVLSGGRSPGFWQRFTEYFNGNFSDSSFTSVFTAYASASESVIDVAKCDMTSYLSATTVVLSDGSGSIPYAELNLYDALGANGGIWNLAAVYLNAKFGLYTIPLPFSNEQDLIEHIWGTLYVQQEGVPTSFDALVSSFTNGSTLEGVPSGVGCS